MQIELKRLRQNWSACKNDLDPSLGIELIQFNEFLKLFKDDQSYHFSPAHFF